MLRQSVGLALFLGTLAVLSSEASAGVVSDFSSNDEGWQIVSFGDPAVDDFSIVGTYAPAYNASGGNPGGYISSNDPDGGAFTFSAPSAFLGNKSGATGLSYDLTHPDGAINYQTADLILEGSGTRLLWQSSVAIMPGSGWTNVAVSFTPSSEWHVGTSGGSLATAGDFSLVLGNVTGLFIRGEYTNGAELAGLDNVFLSAPSAVPEPGSLTLLGLGSLGLAGFARRRRNAV